MKVNKLCTQNLILLSKQSIRLSPNLAKAVKAPGHIVGKFFASHDFSSDEGIRANVGSYSLKNFLAEGLYRFNPEEASRVVFLENEQGGKRILDYFIADGSKADEGGVKKYGVFATNDHDFLIARACARAGMYRQTLVYLNKTREKISPIIKQGEEARPILENVEQGRHYFRFLWHFDNLYFSRAARMILPAADKRTIAEIRKRMGKEAAAEPPFIRIVSQIFAIKYFYGLVPHKKPSAELIENINQVIRGTRQLKTPEKRAAAQILTADIMMGMGLFAEAEELLRKDALPATKQIKEVILRALRQNEIWATTVKLNQSYKAEELFDEIQAETDQMVGAESLDAYMAKYARMNEKEREMDEERTRAMVLAMSQSLIFAGESQRGPGVDDITDLAKETDQLFPGAGWKGRFLLGLAENALLLGRIKKAEELIRQALSLEPR